MNVSAEFAPLWVAFLVAAGFAGTGWFYLVRTRTVCEWGATKGWPKSLAHACYRGKAAYVSFKVGGVVSLLASVVILGSVAWRLLGGGH